MDKDEITIRGEIAKFDDSQNLVFGWASVVERNGEPVKDFDDDMITPDELEKAAYLYMLNSREAGEMHEVTTGVGKIVESMVFTKEKQVALGLENTPLPIGWWIGFKVSPEVHKKIRDGTYKMFSIGGKGIRETADA